jgi:hypothetical protein
MIESTTQRGLCFPQCGSGYVLYPDNPHNIDKIGTYGTEICILFGIVVKKYFNDTVAAIAIGNIVTYSHDNNIDNILSPIDNHITNNDKVTVYIKGGYNGYDNKNKQIVETLTANICQYFPKCVIVDTSYSLSGRTESMMIDMYGNVTECNLGYRTRSSIECALYFEKDFCLRNMCDKYSYNKIYFDLTVSLRNAVDSFTESDLLRRLVICEMPIDESIIAIDEEMP